MLILFDSGSIIHAVNAYSSVIIIIDKYAVNFTGEGASFNLQFKNRNFYSAVRAKNISAMLSALEIFRYCYS